MSSPAVKSLTASQCILLTAHFASAADIKSLYSFTPARSDALDPALVLQIVLTYLPESTEPGEYAGYVEAVASRLYLDYEREAQEVDTTFVEGKGEREARKVVAGLKGLEGATGGDLLTRFLVARAARIEEETGMLPLIPRLVAPFLGRSEALRTWFVACVLPVLRLEGEYYAASAGGEEVTLREVETVQGRAGVDLLLRKVERGVEPLASDELERSGSGRKRGVIARDVKGLVGPWMYGHRERKRRKLAHEPDRQAHDTQPSADVNGLARHVRKISLSGVTSDDKTGHDWEALYAWLVQHARTHFDLVTQCIEGWDGPADVDLSGYGAAGDADGYLDDELQKKLELQYAQAAFAACYAVQADTEATVRGAHGILARLAELLEFIPPPDLATSVDALPRIDRHATRLDQSRTVRDLSPDALLEPEHPLTTPRLETYMLLQMIVYSAYQLSGLGHPVSLVNVAKLQFYANADEQLEVLRKILRLLAGSGAKRDETQWSSDRAKLMWLWNWGIDQEGESVDEGPGVLGKIRREGFEEEMLRAFTETACYGLPIQLYLKSDGGDGLLKKEKVEDVVLGKAMEAYDGASNGNRTRGGVRKAADILAAFQPYFRDSVRIRQANALIAATHSLSFYSLRLQHGVPFQPVSIRVSHDPVGLVDKVLEQNARSYTKLDDLISIARNLVGAGLRKPSNEDDEAGTQADDGESAKKEAERRVTFMAVQAALREDDFDTAYSYIVSRLTPFGADMPTPSPNPEKPPLDSRTRTSAPNTNNTNDDDISWRAAFLAGRYRGSTTSSTPPSLRRLEQRTELLSLALLLAPTSALTEILAAWRRCEEETVAMQRAVREAEREFDDRADKRLSGGSSALPGGFGEGVGADDMVGGRDVARFGVGAGGKGAVAEAPMSMFDLTRRAAGAFSRGVVGGGLRGAGGGVVVVEEEEEEAAADGPARQRVRKRDMVASAVSGSLASGLGWVLGATPVDRRGVGAGE
ncbi:secretory pathway Sec39 [Teratosphaeria nubilosa]|uniref:Secretory pathway Sec39 n=1 Tax=Teratosphaeria nubilosa TaxID=161662 RepID=A0A6G1LK29_9PEZI|nr:secretory pathway Sec39 [Teratosphaeria nubilosa]